MNQFLGVCAGLLLLVSVAIFADCYYSTTTKLRGILVAEESTLIVEVALPNREIRVVIPKVRKNRSKPITIEHYSSWSGFIQTSKVLDE